MFCKYLKLNLDYEDIDSDDYEYGKADGSCNICGSSTNNTYITYLHEIKTKAKACYLCHVVTNFKKYHMGKVFLAVSNLTQEEINIKTMKYYIKNGIIPLPSEIDNTCKKINMQVYQFIKDLCQMSKTDKKIFNNVVLFFTGESGKYLVKYQKSFFANVTDSTSSSDKNIYVPHSIKYFDIPNYVFNSDQLAVLKKIETNKKCNKVMLNMKQKIKITNKILNLEC